MFGLSPLESLILGVPAVAALFVFWYVVSEKAPRRPDDRRGRDE